MTEFRRQDDYTLTQLYAQMIELDGALNTLNTELQDHVKREDYILEDLHACVHKNAELIKDEIKQLKLAIEDIKDSIIILALKDAGVKTWTLVTWMRKFVLWATPVVAFGLLAWAIFLYIIGKGPFPR